MRSFPFCPTLTKRWRVTLSKTYLINHNLISMNHKLHFNWQEIQLASYNQTIEKIIIVTFHLSYSWKRTAYKWQYILPFQENVVWMIDYIPSGVTYKKKREKSHHSGRQTHMIKENEKKNIFSKHDDWRFASDSHFLIYTFV